MKKKEPTRKLDWKESQEFYCTIMDGLGAISLDGVSNSAYFGEITVHRTMTFSKTTLEKAKKLSLEAYKEMIKKEYERLFGK